MPINTSFGNFDLDDYDPRRSLVLVGVIVQGLTSGGISVETPEFLFPVEMCCGCLLSCPVDADDTDVPGPDCCDTTEPESELCNGGQDSAVDCRFCKGSLSSPLLFELCSCGQPVCPAGPG
jgi:hypothetical protein